MAEFKAFCVARFGLDEVRACHAIFRELQTMADENTRVVRAKDYW
ncbi:hypothetical protein [Chitiniphilus shinanonensis]